MQLWCIYSRQPLLCCLHPTLILSSHPSLSSCAATCTNLIFNPLSEDKKKGDRGREEGQHLELGEDVAQLGVVGEAEQAADGERAQAVHLAGRHAGARVQQAQQHADARRSPHRLPRARIPLPHLHRH